MTNNTKIIFDQSERVCRWVSFRPDSPRRLEQKGIGLERDGELVAGVIYEDFNGSSIAVHQRIAAPLTRAYVFSIFAYPFIQLGCSLMMGFVSSGNAKAMRLNEHFGFERTAVLPDAHPEGDLILYTMRREQCRFLSWGNRL